MKIRIAGKQKGFLLIEVIGAFLMLVLLVPVAGRMTVLASSLLKRTSACFQCRLMARDLALRENAGEILDFSREKAMIGRDSFTRDRRSSSWDSSGLVLVTWTVTHDVSRETASIAFLKAR